MLEWNDGPLYDFPFLYEALQDLADVNTRQLVAFKFLQLITTRLNQEAFEPN
jgi:hypothetical protein